MQPQISGHVPPKTIQPSPTATPARPNLKAVAFATDCIRRALEQDGASFSAAAVAEETGLQPGVVTVIAAHTVVAHEMVGLGMIEDEDAIRLGSAALAESIRIHGKRHSSIERDGATPPLRSGDVIGLRRMANDSAAEKRLVTDGHTICARCGARADAECAHQGVIGAHSATA